MTAKLLLPLLVAFAAAASNTFTVSGVLIEHGTNQPVKYANVLLSPVEHRDRQIAYRTGDDGRFLFTNLAAGKYSLEARIHNSVQALDEHEGYATAIAVGPNLDSEHIVFALAQRATIKGSVLDEDGEPVRDAQVFLLHRGIFNGRFQVALQTQQNTGPSGTFHFAHLRPGTYFVAVSARPWYAQWAGPADESQQPDSLDLQQRKNREEFNVAYPVTYYADAVDAAAASPITLSEGGIAEFPINLHPIPAVSIELTGAESLALSTAVRAVGGVLIPVNGIQFGDDHRRILGGIAPGRYLLTAQGWHEGSPTVAREREVELVGNSTLDLSQIPPIDVSGELHVDKTESLRGLAVAFTNVRNGQMSVGWLAADGSFRIAGNLQPGQYEIQLANTRDHYMESVAVRGAPYANGVLEISDGAVVHIAIVAREGLSQVNGVALKNGKPFAGAMVLLLPQNANHGTHIPRDQSDSDGTFTLNFAPPGRYTLVAIDDGADLAYRDSSVIQPYLAGGQTIDVPVAPDSSVKVNVQARLK